MMRYSVLIMLLILAGCTAPDDRVLPTLTNPDAAATSLVLTEYAPPTGYDTVSFPAIDANLERLNGWRYEMFFSFDGVFARTSRVAAASYRASVTYDQVGSARRVDAILDVNLEQNTTPIQFEGVRLGPSTFLVREGLCSTDTPDSELLADLSAGDLLGGVQMATTAARTEVINGQQVWLYQFFADELVTPNINIGDDGRLLSMQGELWVAPEYDAVIRFNVTLDVENATIFEQPLPITGLVSIQYDLFDIGVVPNISIPNGC